MIYLISNFKNLMKLYKDYAKEPFSLLVSSTSFLSDNPLRFKKKLF